MPSYSKNDVILVRYPFSDLSATQLRRLPIAARRTTSTLGFRQLRAIRRLVYRVRLYVARWH